MSQEFIFPQLHSFPPFFTLQRNAEVRRLQVQTWCTLVLRWVRHQGTSRVHLSDPLPCFSNPAIERTLSREGISAVLTQLHKSGNLEWLNKEKTMGEVLWQSPSSWADKVYQWAADSSRIGGVCTLYELTRGDDVTDQEFYCLADEVMLKVLKILESQGRAEIIDEADLKGVKFLQA